jgi:hypothetical protein
VGGSKGRIGGERVRGCGQCAVSGKAFCYGP